MNRLLKTRTRYILVGSDFSQQEPRILSQFSQDDNMINAYNNDRDLYATIAMGVYHNNYEDNLECNPNGTLNPEGKKRRSNCKSLLLGIMYGRGVTSIAEQIKGTPEEAQNIIDNFYKGFPKVKGWMNESLENARVNGYVEDIWGKRRRLTDLLRPRYEFKFLNSDIDFNPFLICNNRVKENNKINYYEKKLAEIRGRRQFESIKNNALKEGIEIIDNGGFISAAERQCVNARIQGSAATMTKLAMLKLYNDKELESLGFKLLIGVHDELIGECPVENVDRVQEILTYDMRTACPNFSVPFKCDADVSYNWYWSDYKSVVLEEFLNYAKEHDNNYKEAFKFIVNNHEELTSENLKDVTEGYIVD